MSGAIAPVAASARGGMAAFAALIDQLIYTRSRNAKLHLIAEYLKATPDPDRGWAMAALTGELDLAGVKPAQVRAMIGRASIRCCFASAAIMSATPPRPYPCCGSAALRLKTCPMTTA